MLDATTADCPSSTTFEDAPPEAPSKRMIPFDMHRDRVNDVLTIVGEGVTIGNQVRALSRLMLLSLVNAEPGKFDQVMEEFYLAIDVLETMAARLEAHETRAGAHHARLFAEAER